MGQMTGGREVVDHDGDMMMGVYYRSPDNDDHEEADKVFRQFEEVSCSQPVVLMGVLKVFDICWKSDKARCKLTRTFLESIRINFLIQALEGSNRCDT